MAHLFGNQLSGFLVDDLVDGRHRAQFHHRFDDLRTFDRHFVGQLANGDGFADHNIAVNCLSRLLEALLQRRTFAMFAAFTAANGRTGFFTVSFRFSVFVAFLRRASSFAVTATAATAFNFTIVIIFSLTRMLRRGYVIVGRFFWGFRSFTPVFFIFFSHTACFFRYTARFFFKFAACFFFRFALQLRCFVLTAGLFSLGGLGHFVGMLIAHFVFFRGFTFRFFSDFTFSLFCGLTFSF